MSSSPTAPISTTGSSTSSGFPGGIGGSSPLASRAQRAEVIACGAIAGHVREVAVRRAWPVAVAALPAVLHNRPAQIIEAARPLVQRARQAGIPVAMAYADCGTYGALDAFCREHGIARLPGLHCYDLFAGPSRMTDLFDREPGTYVLTDFLLRGFDRLVLGSLGLDRYPELWPDYFGHYTRLVWLAQSPSPALEAQADRVAALFGLPLTRIDTGLSRLERELERLVISCR